MAIKRRTVAIKRGSVVVFRDKLSKKLRAVPGTVFVPRGGVFEVVNVNDPTTVSLPTEVKTQGPPIHRESHIYFHIAPTTKPGRYTYKAKSIANGDFAVGQSPPKIIIYDP